MSPRPLGFGRPRPGHGQLPPTDSPFLRQMRASFGTAMVRVIRNPGTDDEESFDVEAHIQKNTGSFDVGTPVFTGDFVELPDPRLGPDGVERRYVAKATVLQGAPDASTHRVKAEWGEPAAPQPSRVAPIRRLTFENLHAEVRDAAGDMYADGHYEAAVAEAFKSIEVRVRRVTAIEKSGASLMGDAFRQDGSVLDVAVHDGRSGQDERDGFHALFRGSMLGIRNQGAHELFEKSDPQEALEYLAFASLLHRRVDKAESKRASS